MLIIGHRGASGYAPENTLKSIELAIAMHCHGIEIDVHEADGKLWVIHDSWLQKTTNGQGIIHQQKSEYLESLDAGDNEKIPTLKRVLKLINGRCMLNIEVKTCNSIKPILALVNHAIDQLNFSNQQIIISSFNHHYLHKIKQHRPNTLIGALTASLPLDYGKFGQLLNAYSVNVDINTINKAFVEDVHRRDMKIFVYTVNEEPDIERMYRLYVDGIFTNYPDKAFNVITSSL